MIEAACTFLCAISSTISAILFWNTLFAQDGSLTFMAQVFAVIVVLISGYMVVSKFH